MCRLRHASGHYGRTVVRSRRSPIHPHPAPARRRRRDRVAAAGLVLAAGILVACVGQRPTTGDRVEGAATLAPDGVGATTTVAGPSATGAPSTGAGTSGASGATTAAGAPPTGAAVADPMAKIPAAGTFEGKRPPQFVLVSFDGAADPKLMARWRAAADASGAKLTYFLSAVYLLGKQTSTVYQGPGHAAGASAIGFSPTPAGQDDKAYITAVVRSLQDAARAGDEIGNHYGGHWCGNGGVNTWDKGDWAAELNQVESLVLKVDTNNALPTPVGPPYDPLRVAGSRTPCLEGKLDELYPVLRARGYRYDASNTKGLFDWPRQRKGLWAFGFAGITIAGLDRPTLTVDFSISTGFKGAAVNGTLTTEQTNQIYTSVRDAYLAAFDTLYHGNRTPFEISNHFNTSDGDAYNRAVEDVMRTVCGKPEVVCATYGDVVSWLDAHADQIGAFQAGSFTKLPKG